jgi:hypothetical protein
MHCVVRRGVVGVVVAASLAVGACAQKEEPLGPTATVPQATTTTDPYAIPSVIDEAYVNRVLAGLDHALGEVTRIVVSERAVSDATVNRLRRLYIGEYFNLIVASYEADMQNGFSTYSDNPGDRQTIVTDLLSATSSCVFAEVARDYSAASSRPSAPTTEWVAIRHSTDINIVDNPVRWTFLYDGYDMNHSQPSNPCVATS